MAFGLGTYAVGLLAGVLSTLSPCVLPLIPVLLGTALGSHRLGPLALTLGLMMSFAVLGTAIAYVGVSLGLDPNLFQNIGAVVLAGFAVVLLSSRLQARVATATSGLSTAGGGLLAKMSGDGLQAQFLIGLVLGIVWSPCVGPTLGAAITLASQGRNLPQIALLMGFFGLGAGLPLIVLGVLSRTAMMKIRGKLLRAGQHGKTALGALMLFIAIAVFTGVDKRFEAWAVEHSPAWLTELTTRY